MRCAARRLRADRPDGRHPALRQPGRVRLARDGTLDARIPIAPTFLGDDGAGHVAPPVLAALRDAASALPVALCVRPERGTLLYGAYGFEGAEGDLRASGALPAAALSPQAARMILLAGLGAGAGRDVLTRALEP